MVYSTAERVAEPLEERAPRPRATALLLVDGKRLVVGPAGATLGRSRQCDVVLNDPNVRASTPRSDRAAARGC